MDLKKWMDIGVDFVTAYGLKIISAIIIWVIGSWIIKKLLNTTSNVMTKRGFDVSLQKFLLNLVGWVLKILLILAILQCPRWV